MYCVHIHNLQCTTVPPNPTPTAASAQSTENKPVQWRTEPKNPTAPRTQHSENRVQNSGPKHCILNNKIIAFIPKTIHYLLYSSLGTDSPTKAF